MQDLEKGNEEPGVIPNLPPHSAISRRGRARRKYLPINSWSAARARASLQPSLPEALSPLPFSFEDPPQSLTARRAAKPLARAVTGAYEPLFASWALAAKKIEITRWGMTLASMRRRRAGRLRCRGNCCLGIGHLGIGLGGKGCGGQSALGAPASVPLALSLPFFSHFRFLAMFPPVTFIPPSSSRLAALGTAIPGLGMGGAKWFLAVFEQTRPLARPTSPLTCARFTRC
jgi:hypothetical protein